MNCAGVIGGTAGIATCSGAGCRIEPGDRNNQKAPHFPEMADETWIWLSLEVPLEETGLYLRRSGVTR